MTDYPNLRASCTCRLCGGAKDIGCVVCWACYRKRNCRNGMPKILERFEHALGGPAAASNCPDPGELAADRWNETHR